MKTKYNQVDRHLHDCTLRHVLIRKWAQVSYQRLPDASTIIIH